MSEYLKQAAERIKRRTAKFKHLHLKIHDRIELQSPLKDAQAGERGTILNISPDMVCTVLMDGRKFPWQMYPDKFTLLGATGVQGGLFVDAD